MNFKAPYNLADYVDFFQSYFLPEDFESCKEKSEINFQTHFIENITKLGEVPSLDLSVYEAKHQSENDPRVSLSRDSFRFLAQYGVKRALILFISKNSPNYRLSLVTIDLKWEEGKRVKKEYSNPRRYSFFLGPDSKTHTPEEYLIKLGRIKDFDDLKNRFSIEVVNKEFYTQIAILFTKLAGGKRTIGREEYDEKGVLKLPSTNDDTIKKEFSVRFIGRLVFCWFLRKKCSENGISLLPEDLLSSSAVSRNKSYYHKILEPLFFEVLNTPISDRKKEYRNGFWCKVPFLNGGLFTPHLHDFFDPEPLGMSKHINTLKIPGEWITELFEIFETYNFTIDENTSMDVELAIEPEMLGRIFENLLAEINPETGETARKATGSYYTPRPIVDYMVDESLKQYFLTTTNLHEDKISSLLAYEEAQVDLTSSEKDSAIEVLDRIKIIDPACGSGAFPMGILQKMLLVLQKVDPDSKKWRVKKLAQIDDKILKKELEARLKQENWDYVHKLGIIQSSIYGIDIQPIAVDISKLRFFLSLIVDEKIDDTKENRGIEPLPNLEFKFVCANSLVGLSRKEAQQTMFEATDDIDLLRNLRDEYLRSYGKEKEKIEKKFKETQSRMFRHSLSWGGKDSQTLKLSQWDPFSFESCGWFDPEWMFGIKGQFDIVIANPPYGADLDATTRKHIEEVYRYTTGNSNSAILFIEKGLQLTSARGTICFIIPKSFTYSDSWVTARNMLKENLKNLLDVGKGFENVLLEQVVFIATKQSHPSLLFTAKMGSEGLITNRAEIEKDDCDLFGIYITGLSSEELMVGKKIIKGRSAFTDICYIKRGLDIQKYLVSRDWNIDVFRCKSIGRYMLKPATEGLTFKKAEKLHNDIEYMKSPKILIQNIVAHVVNPKEHIILMATVDRQGVIGLGSIGNVYITNTEYSVEYLTALLNSTLISWYAYRFIYGHAIRTMRFDNYHLSKLPFAQMPKTKQEPFIKLVNEILNAKKRNNEADTTAQELEIDRMVYKLYGLKKDDIAMIEC